MGVDQTTSSRAAPPETTALAWEALLDLGTGPGSRVERLERAIRDAARGGRVPVGAALPPSRQLAETLGVSRWVVTEAYGQLVAEGFLEARAGSATRVSAAARPGSPGRPWARVVARPPGTAGHERRTTDPAHRRARPVRPRTGRPRSPARPARRVAPRGTRGARHVRRDGVERRPRPAVPAGHPHARAVVAGHLRRARVVTGPDDAVVLTRGATDGMARVAAALVEAGHTHLLVEDPSWSVLRDVAARAGLTPSRSPWTPRVRTSTRSSTRPDGRARGPRSSRPRTSSPPAPRSRPSGARPSSPGRGPSTASWSRTTTTPSSATTAGPSRRSSSSTPTASCFSAR